ncbi:MAG: YDG domain-containing protein [Christensenellales bacterium]
MLSRRDPVIITGIDDKTVTFNGKTQGIDLSKANISGDAVDVSELTVTYTKDGKTVAEPRDAGTYDVAISYEDTNYIGSTTAKLIINKKEVTVTGFEAQSKVYDGKADAVVNSTNAKLDGMIEGTDVGFDKSGLTFKFDDKDVGTNKTVKNTTPITLTGTDKDNYNLKKPTVELTADITAKPVTVTADVKEKGLQWPYRRRECYH